ncbi:uncharacterized protein LOC135480746 [Liolophura sinensis]|uniref:uncharacterized protein LOC135480746 n=1 Tax=Liolophura sinensis TaxID=3198878 RepID=UPI0031582CD9
MRLRLWIRLRRVLMTVLYIGICLLVLDLIGIPRLIEQLMADPTRLSLFTHNTVSFCGGNFKGYVNKFAHLKMVILDPKKSDGRVGGEDVKSVLEQPEFVEYFEFSPGYFTLECSAIPTYRFRDEHHLNMWMDVLKPQDPTLTTDILQAKGGDSVRKKFTIAVTRYEYANLYHQMADIYNAYIMLRVFNLDPDKTDILFVDGHPKSNLDEIWDTLFGDVIRAGHLKEPLLFENLIWNIQGYTSSIHQHDREKIPEVPEFGHFVLHRHGMSENRKLDCRNISVLFIWRRNYVAHPRNPSGVVARKVLNENEVISFVQNNLHVDGKPTGTVKGIHLEAMSFGEQLQHIRNTDILIGIHGAGLSHALFLPQHAGLIEIFSSRKLAVNRHFQALARWRGVRYEKYENRYTNNDAGNDDVTLEPFEIAELVNEMRDKICHDESL